MALSGVPSPRLVKALYDFRPSHTDELAFRKGDVICLTQTLEGGWWEGTLGGLTGWFPSNYVKPVKSSSKVIDQSQLASIHAQNRVRSVTEYHSVVLQQWVETERRYVAELFRIGNVLQELLDKGTSRLVDSLGAIRLLLEEMHQTHQGLMSALDMASRRPLPDRTVGRDLLNIIPRLREIYETYYGRHPRAVACLERREVQSVVAACTSLAPSGTGSGGASGLKTLKVVLATPMRHLERYPQHLMELFRHLDPAHPDRADMQIADKLLNDVLAGCDISRRLKEAELNLHRGNVRGWVPEAEPLGAVVHAQPVRLLTAAGTLDERLLLLYTKELIFLSVMMVMESPSCNLEGRFQLSAIRVARVETLDGVENFEHAFELSSTSADRQVILCSCREAVEKWVHCIAECQNQVLTMSTEAAPKYMYNSMSLPRTAGLPHQPSAELVAPPPPLPPHPNLAAANIHPRVARPRQPLCLRPAPPMPPKLMMVKDDSIRSPRLSRKLQRKESARGTIHLAMEPPQPTNAALADDMLILAVIEAYATQSRARHTMNLLDLTKIRLSDSELRQKQADAAFRISSDSSSSGGGAAVGSQELLGVAAATPTDTVASSPASPMAPHPSLPMSMAHGGGACTCCPPSAPMTVKERRV